MLIHCLTMTGLITCAASAAAHHSFAAEFSYELFGSREGKVVEVHFVNPHAHIFFAVKNDNGEEEIWNAHPSTPHPNSPLSLYNMEQVFIYFFTELFSILLCSIIIR